MRDIQAILEEVKEWLAQKRQEDIGFDNNRAFHINLFLDELIKELEE